MRKLSESVWMDIHKRSTKEFDRRENLPGNLAFLKPVDMSGSVLWADVDFEYNDKSYFTYTDLEKILDDTPWRIPTEEEALELEKGNKIDSDKDTIWFDSGQNKLVFERKGYYRGFMDDMRPETFENPAYYYGWTSKDSGMLTSGKRSYVIDGINIRIFPRNKKLDKLPVRLVKSK